MPEDITGNKSNMDSNDSSIVYKAEQISNDYAIKIFKEVFSTSSVIKEIKEKLNNSHFVDLYFEILIKYKIYPILNERLKNYSAIEENEIYPKLLRAVYKPVPKRYKSEFFYKILPCTEKNFEFRLNNYIKDIFISLLYLLKRNTNKDVKFDKEMVAIKCYPQLDYSNMPDKICNNNGIESSRIIIIFGRFHEITFSLRKEIVDFFQNSGFKLVSLGALVFNKKLTLFHLSKGRMRKDISLHSRKNNAVDKWLILRGEFLIQEVFCWSEFIRRFNIKIIFDADMRSLDSIFENIAFGMAQNRGFFCAFQTSELFYPILPLGYQPSNILFSWNKFAQDNMIGNLDHIEFLVSTGYCNYHSWGKETNDNYIKNYIDEMRNRGAKFIVTIFDNVHGGMANPITTSHVVSFYQSFLNWAISDCNIGVIIKSKCKNVLRGLCDINEKVLFLKSLGRCQIMEGKDILPSVVARYTDFSAGIGISTAITEVVLSGGRGIHCDLTKQRNHLFYKWGYKKLIFDDMDGVICALKKYSENPEAIPGLGDWRAFLHALDSFCDNKCFERITLYIRWLLEAMERGQEPDMALQYVNSQYGRRWGEDKITDLKNREGRFSPRGH